MTLPVHILDRTPGAEGRTVAWEKICRGKKRGIIINYEEQRQTSRWGWVKRGRPYVIYWDTLMDPPLSSCKTLEAAEKSAAEWAERLARHD